MDGCEACNNVIKDRTYGRLGLRIIVLHVKAQNRMTKWYIDMSLRQITQVRRHRRLTMAHSTWWSLVIL